MEKNFENLVFNSLDRHIKNVSKKKYERPDEWTNDVFNSVESEFNNNGIALDILNNIRSEFVYYVTSHF